LLIEQAIRMLSVSSADLIRTRIMRCGNPRPVELKELDGGDDESF
jgi:hypothetical protein